MREREVFESRFQIFTAIIVFALLLKAIYDFSLSQLTGKTAVAALIVIALSLIPLKLKDRLTFFKDDFFLGLPSAIYLLLTGNVAVAKIAVFSGLMLSSLIPPRTRSISQFINETFAVYVSFIAFGVLKEVISIIPGIREWQIITIALIALALSYGYLKGYLISKYLNFKSSGIYRNYFSFNSVFIVLSASAALYMYTVQKEADYYRNLWIFLLPAVAALTVCILTGGRNRLYHVIHGVNGLLAGSEEDARLQRLSHEYAVGIANEIALPAVYTDKMALAAMLHDVGKSGMHEYSVEHILETISSARGEPLHAERGYSILSSIPGLLDIATIIKKHHEPAVNVRLTRSAKKELITLSQALNIVMSFAEKLVYASDEPITEKEAYKSLRRDAGLDYNPRLLRKLKEYLQRKGIKRL